MNKMTNTRIIFDKDFYILQAVLNSNKFGRLFTKFRQEMELKGLPFPQRGFKTVKEYHEWSIKAHVKDIYYEGFIENAIKEFNVKEEHREKFQLGLQWYVYFGRKEAPIQFTHGKLINISNDNQSVKVELSVYPWTVKKDIIDGLWKEIEAEQQNLVEYKSGKRNREWETFERNFKIYEIYLNLKKQKIRPIIDNLIESPKFKKLKSEYKIPKTLDERLGSVISRCKKALGNLNLL